MLSEQIASGTEDELFERLRVMLPSTGISMAQAGLPAHTSYLLRVVAGNLAKPSWQSFDLITALLMCLDGVKVAHFLDLSEMPEYMELLPRLIRILVQDKGTATGIIGQLRVLQERNAS